jgi:hypothetical protein
MRCALTYIHQKNVVSRSRFVSTNRYCLASTFRNSRCLNSFFGPIYIPSPLNISRVVLSILTERKYLNEERNGEEKKLTDGIHFDHPTHTTAKKKKKKIFAFRSRLRPLMGWSNFIYPILVF